MYLPMHLSPSWWYCYTNIDYASNLINFIRDCTNKNGGIGNGAASYPYLETTFYGVVSLGLFNCQDKLSDKLYQYIIDKQNVKGGFGESSDSSPNLFNTFYAIVSLKVLGKITPDVREKTSRFILNSIIQPGGFYENRHPGMNTTSLFWSLYTMKCLAMSVEDYRHMMERFLSDCFDEKARLFAPFPGGLANIQSSYEAIVVLNELSLLGRFDLDGISNAIYKRKEESYFVDDLLGYGTIATSMWAIQSLSILGTLDRFKFNIYNLLHVSASVIMQPTSVFDIFCATNILINMTQEKGVVNLERQFLLREEGITSTDVAGRVNELSLLLEKRGLDRSEYDFFSAVSVESQLNLRPGMYFLQILINPDSDRIYEIENVKGEVLALTRALSRVSKECITHRVISKRRLKILGVYNPTEDLDLEKKEQGIMNSFCKYNLIYDNRAVFGDSASKIALLTEIADGCDVFYYSGHTADGNLILSDDKIPIPELFDRLLRSGCSIVILNSCSTYQSVRDYYLTQPHISDNFNVICTINDVHDESGIWFIQAFLYLMEYGIPISESVRIAKQELAIRSKRLGLTWWGYVLFGNPYTLIA